MESIDYQIDGAEETAVRYTEYQYDRRGQTTGYAELSQENEPTADEIKAHQIRYYYDSDGKLTKVTYPTTKNGVQALAYEYDQNGWLTKIKGEVQSGDGSTEKTVRSYTYDSYGKVKEIKDYRDLLNSSDQAVKKVYTYDSLDRVKEMTYTDLETGKVMESYQYSYDKNSNITKKTQVNNYPKEDANKVNETKSYTYDTLGRLTKTVTTDHKKDDKTKTVTYTYDNVGNRLKEDDGTTTISYTYNGLDQLKTSTKEKGTAVEEVRQYDYDANGNQNSQNLIGTDGNVLATERFQQNATQYYLYNKDIQGSTSSLVKEDGSADATYRYTDFGETTINGDNKAENEVCYTGGIYDHSTGLYYLNARYYNPEDGRFVTEDTYRGETAKPETGHLYAYCANNPVNYVDPSGHKAKTVIYYNKKGKDFKKQAMHSPYYKNSQVTFKSVIKKAQFKKEWDKIPKGTSELYLYLHGGVSCLYFDGSDMNLKELLALKKKKIKKKIVLLSCKGGIGDKNSVAKIMAKKCQCVVYASSYPYGLSYRYDKKKKVYYPRYGGKRNYYNHENPLKKYKP